MSISMTAEEILEVIEQAGIRVNDFAYGDFETPEGVGPFEEVDQVGGEGQGDHWHSVKYFKDHDVYIKTIGFYSSYNGTDFYNGYGKEVRPKEKTITIFE